MIVTAGPTFESLDQVRRLTNFSTGRLGCELAGYLTAWGCEVTLLLGEQATYRGERQARTVAQFTTTASLREQLHALSSKPFGAIFHAAAVSDFAFGKIWARTVQGSLMEVTGGKLPTRQGSLLAELIPTPKILGELRKWFPQAILVGWKYEVEGNRAEVLRLAETQIAECQTDACAANGAAYGPGFGLVRPGGKCTHAADVLALFGQLEALLAESTGKSP